MLIAFHKPYGVLSQFSAGASRHRTLADFGFPPGVYPLGRLDATSEGLLLLSDERELVARLLDPERGHRRVYWVQVEGVPTPESLRRLTQGISLVTGVTRPCQAYRLESPAQVPERAPPIRIRKRVPDCWIGLELREGKNRQVRRMTAAAGHPTLRLLRVQIGALALAGLAPGEWRVLSDSERQAVFERPLPARMNRPR